jgi:hypothetical protein
MRIASVVLIGDKRMATDSPHDAAPDRQESPSSPAADDDGNVRGASPYDVLPVGELARMLNKKNERGVLEFARRNPDFPLNRKVRPPVAVRGDVVRWIQLGYSDEARRALNGEPRPTPADLSDEARLRRWIAENRRSKKRSRPRSPPP